MGKMPHYHQRSVGESMPGFHVNNNIVHLPQHRAGELLDCCSTSCKTSHILETADEVIVGVIVSKPFKDTHERERTTGSSSYVGCDDWLTICQIQANTKESIKAICKNTSILCINITTCSLNGILTGIR